MADSILSVASQTPVMMEAFKVSDTRPRTGLIFPSDLGQKDIPTVVFHPKLPPTSRGPIPHINLPIPPNLSFSDSAQYSNLDLGIIGMIGAETINQAAKQNSVMGAAGAFAGGLAGGVVNKIGKLNAAAAASIIARNALRMESAANTIDFSSKQVIAPNTNSAFQNTSVRGFGFSFKLISKNAKESMVAKDIVSTFREFLYPEGNDVVMSYPPLWEIKFMNSVGEENKFIPRIYTSYLTGFSSTYNASMNAFHSDGSPVEVDISLTFQESKALTRNDIQLLAKNL